MCVVSWMLMAWAASQSGSTKQMPPPPRDPLEPLSGLAGVSVTLPEQSAFVIQAFALALAGGAERIAFNKMRNDNPHPELIEPYGLLRADDPPVAQLLRLFRWSAITLPESTENVLVAIWRYLCRHSGSRRPNYHSLMEHGCYSSHLQPQCNCPSGSFG